ncbi:single-stranded DNA-binding protein [Isoptericola sp. NEAU-Y5]|uniref:Single-stranded DNA-binding protein n=1 Tax=Isoptericola luteus TaxID=2879484 RepID=A0ABS7ZEL7_9MICO|nr:single-stranded DNA-binding protein [Isoptericola sp. NEAU-Y5]MCA5893353.1 single-stranded DNA-binding protein [Isoptericola sp. NEAU-Y5]
MSDVNVTVVGHAGTEPALATSANGTEWTTFRLASTRRVRDPRTGEWKDGDTLWFTVKLFRDRARHVSLSLRKGDPVVVVGRLGLEEWETERVHELPGGGTTTITERRSRLVVDAQQVGVDATRGMVRFARVEKHAGPDRGDQERGDHEPGGLERGVAVPDDASSLVPPDPWATAGPDASASPAGPGTAGTTDGVDAEEQEPARA